MNKFFRVSLIVLAVLTVIVEILLWIKTGKFEVSKTLGSVAFLIVFSAYLKLKDEKNKNGS